ncbi:MAG: hypothetical protein E6I71_01000, partial [Chloroflexi bacterium]
MRRTPAERLLTAPLPYPQRPQSTATPPPFRAAGAVVTSTLGSKTLAGGHVYKSLLLSINALCASIVWAQSPASSSAQSKPSVRWEELTAADFRDAIARAQGACLLPFGILEKHGLHLPLGNDLLNVRYVALNAAQQEYAVV